MKRRRRRRKQHGLGALDLSGKKKVIVLAGLAATAYFLFGADIAKAAEGIFGGGKPGAPSSLPAPTPASQGGSAVLQAQYQASKSTSQSDLEKALDQMLNPPAPVIQLTLQQAGVSIVGVTNAPPTSSDICGGFARRSVKLSNGESISLALFSSLLALQACHSAVLKAGQPWPVRIDLPQGFGAKALMWYAPADILSAWDATHPDKG